MILTVVKDLIIYSIDHGNEPSLSPLLKCLIIKRHLSSKLKKIVLELYVQIKGL